MKLSKPLLVIGLVLLIALAVGVMGGLVTDLFFPGARDTMAQAVALGAVTGAVCAPVIVLLVRRGGS